MLDMNTIGLFNYLTELDEEQKQRKQEIDRVIDRIQKERFRIQLQLLLRFLLNSLKKSWNMSNAKFYAATLI